MLAKRLAAILPNMTLDEAHETAKIHSIKNKKRVIALLGSIKWSWVTCPLFLILFSKSLIASQLQVVENDTKDACF
jgi:hypothetical protein